MGYDYFSNAPNLEENFVKAQNALESLDNPAMQMELASAPLQGFPSINSGGPKQIVDQNGTVVWTPT